MEDLKYLALIAAAGLLLIATFSQAQVTGGGGAAPSHYAQAR
jgi:hypothetical protein